MCLNNHPHFQPFRYLLLILFLQTREYSVEMTCGGCQKAVNTVLNKTEGNTCSIRLNLKVNANFRYFVGVSKVDIDLPAKKVVVEGTATKEAIEAALKKTGKAFTFVK